MDILSKAKELEEEKINYHSVVEDKEPEWEYTTTSGIKIINYDLELVADLKNALNKGLINKDQLRNALDKGEITLREYVKIVE